MRVSGLLLLPRSSTTVFLLRPSSYPVPPSSSSFCPPVAEALARHPLVKKIHWSGDISGLDLDAPDGSRAKNGVPLEQIRIHKKQAKGPAPLICFETGDVELSRRFCEAYVVFVTRLLPTNILTCDPIFVRPIFTVPTNPSQNAPLVLLVLSSSRPSLVSPCHQVPHS